MEGIQHRDDCPTRTRPPRPDAVADEVYVDGIGGEVTLTRCRLCGRSAMVHKLAPKGTLHE